MKLKSWTLEPLVILLLFAVALGMRLVRLGDAPLTDLEAGHALQALNLARGTQGVLGDQPGYIALTAPSFVLLGDGDFLARFWPAQLQRNGNGWIRCVRGSTFSAACLPPLSTVGSAFWEWRPSVCA